MSKRKICFYCKDCSKVVTKNKKDDLICGTCGYTFSISPDMSGYSIHMRSNITSQTKVEFNTTTMNDSIDRMNNG